MGGRRIGRYSSIPACQQLRHPTRFTLSLAHSDQCPRNISDHVVQKGVGLYFDDYDPAAATHLQDIDMSHRCAGLAGSSPECAEVLFAQQGLCFLLHALFIEWMAYPGKLVGRQRRPDS